MFISAFVLILECWKKKNSLKNLNFMCKVCFDVERTIFCFNHTCIKWNNFFLQLIKIPTNIFIIRGMTSTYHGCNRKYKHTLWDWRLNMQLIIIQLIVYCIWVVDVSMCPMVWRKTLTLKINLSHAICYSNEDTFFSCYFNLYVTFFFSTFLLCHSIGHSQIFIRQLPIYNALSPMTVPAQFSSKQLCIFACVCRMWRPSSLTPSTAPSTLLEESKFSSRSSLSWTTGNRMTALWRRPSGEYWPSRPQIHRATFTITTLRVHVSFFLSNCHLIFICPLYLQENILPLFLIHCSFLSQVNIQRLQPFQSLGIFFFKGIKAFIQ